MAKHLNKDFQRFLGLELSGPKNERSSLCVLDYSIKTHRLIVVDIETKLVGANQTAADEILISLVKQSLKDTHTFSGLACQAPLSLPPFFKHFLEKKEGAHFSRTKDSETRWMDQIWKKTKPRPRPFEPYLQRPSEIWLKYHCTENFQLGDALGANLAPLTARMQFLKTRFPEPLFEVFPRATVTRIVSSLGLNKNITKDYSDLERGLQTREVFFEMLLKKFPQIFIYDKDLDSMITHLNCFHSFINAFTLFLESKDQCESRPKNFPQKSTWVEIPKKKIDWESVFNS